MDKLESYTHPNIELSDLRKLVLSGSTKMVLALLGAGVVIGITLMFPAVAVLFKEFKRGEWEKRRKRGVLRATIKRLEKQKLVAWTEKNGEFILSLTERGNKRLLQYKLDNLTIPETKKWDHMFRVIVFDIPEKKKMAREFLRKKLKEMGFYQWQKSVFVIPFECKDEIDFLRHTLEIAPYVQYLLAKEIPGLEAQLYKHYQIED